MLPAKYRTVGEMTGTMRTVPEGRAVAASAGAQDDTEVPDEFLQARVKFVSIPETQVMHGATFYICKCLSWDQREWAVAKRYSQFERLRRLLSKNAKIGALDFPRKSRFGKHKDSTVEARKQGLSKWMNDVIALEDGRLPLPQFAMFLAEDGSVGEGMLLSIDIDPLRSSFSSTPAAASFSSSALPPPSTASRDAIPPELLQTAPPAEVASDPVLLVVGSVVRVLAEAAAQRACEAVGIKWNPHRRNRTPACPSPTHRGCLRCWGHWSHLEHVSGGSDARQS
jgi:hypothetical protein